MASNSPFTYSETFTDLLNQTSSQVPPFFTTQPAIEDENTLETSRESRRRWSIIEDGVLVSAWLNTSKDAIIGNDQKAGAFWKRIASYFDASPAVKDLPKRETIACKMRWAKINKDVLKFSGCYEQAERQRSSGQSEDDVFQMAYNFYSQDEGNNFTLEHAWRLLRHDQKWCSLISQKGKSHSKRVRVDDSGAYTATSNTDGDMEDQTMERPIGVKAAKAKGKKSVKTPNEEIAASQKALERVWLIKEKDMAAKERSLEKDVAAKDRLSKQKILDTLIGKTEPLSEMEITLKNQLISEMLV